MDVGLIAGRLWASMPSASQNTELSMHGCQDDDEPEEKASGFGVTARRAGLLRRVVVPRVVLIHRCPLSSPIF